MPVATYTSKLVRLFGKNTNVGNSVWENLNEISERVRFPALEGTVQVSSSSAADIATSGTGAWTVLIIGLNADKSNIVQEVLSLKGTTPVVGTLTFSRVFQIEVITAGTEGNKVGDIYCSKSGTAVTSGVPTSLTTSWAKMPAAEGLATSGEFTVPKGKRYTVVKVFSTGLKQSCQIALRSKDGKIADSSYKNIVSYNIGASAPVTIDVPRPEDAANIGELVDLYLVGKAETAGASVCVTVYLLETTNFMGVNG